MTEPSGPHATPPHPPDAPDRRALVRRQFGRDVPCRLVHSERQDARWARVKDISPGGVGLLVGSPFEAAPPVIVELTDSAGVRRFSLAARVAYARLLQDGTWRLGCVFANRLSEAELHALLF